MTHGFYARTRTETDTTRFVVVGMRDRDGTTAHDRIVAATYHPANIVRALLSATYATAIVAVRGSDAGDVEYRARYQCDRYLSFAGCVAQVADNRSDATDVARYFDMEYGKGKGRA